MTYNGDATLVHEAQDIIGESPVWDEPNGILHRVDIAGRALHTWAPGSGATTVREFDGEVAAVVLTTDGRRLVAVERDLWLLDGDDARVLTSLDVSDDFRFNDCQADPRGRLWLGTISRSRDVGASALYRMEPDLTFRRMADATLANGIAWSPAGDRLFFVETWLRRIDVYDFGLETGELSGGRPLVQFEPDAGTPDGLAVDAEGGVWVALFRGWSVRRYLPGGELDRDIRLPVSNAAAVAFGDHDLRRLYVTTGTAGLDAERLAAEPGVGGIWALRPGMTGLEPYRCALPGS